MSAIDPLPPERLKKVVLVDDEKSFTELLAQILNDNLTCRVESFNRPTDALKAIQQEEIGVLVTDYYMPVMNGIDLIRKLQEAQPAVPAILITGHSLKLNPEDTTKLRSLKKIIAKPFGWRRLADAIIEIWPDPTRPQLKG